MRYILYILVVSSLLFAWSCTDLDEEIRDQIVQGDGDVDVAGLLTGAYQSLNAPMVGIGQWMAISEHTTDELIAPTRGGDWDDGGQWRVLHTHEWTAEHPNIRDSYNQLLTVVFNTSNILTFDATTERQAAEARFLRAYAMFLLADGWDQVPFRDGETLDNLLLPPNVVTGAEALDFVISELTDIISTLPADGPAYVANQDAANTLLMKAYLNRGTFADRTNPAFPAEDMAQVINYADQVINTGKYSLSSNYFDNFATDNDEISTENIFTLQGVGGVQSSPVHERWYSTLHYNQTPSGWNGFSTLSDFYDSFEDGDQRRGVEYDNFAETGVRVGFLVGQQFGPDGEALTDRAGNPLIFTPEVSIIETGNDLEVKGIRVLKYPIDTDFPSNSEAQDNDHVLFRYADVLLSKAEALHRTGDEAGALEIVNELRAARGASTLAAMTPDDLLAERGREFYWEGQRRTDLIRFGKFLDSWQEKPASGEERLLFPIPATVLATNPNLVQNPGY